MIVVLAIILVIPALARAQQDEDAGVRLGTRFILSDHRGRIVTDEHLSGSFLLIYFGYTHCPDVCPTGLLMLGEAMDRLGEQASKVQPLFVTVDPARDTVEALRDYVASFHPRLLGLTGSPEMIERVARAFRIRFERVEGKTKDSYTVDHTASLLAVAPDGMQVARFPHGTPATQVAAVVREAVASMKAPRTLRR